MFCTLQALWIFQVHIIRPKNSENDMTAIVGILNKQAAVMAADSAVTITHGDTRRIYNNSRKIFKLSDKQPVGLMIYENMEFMGVPLDVVIGHYCEKNQDFEAKDLKGYADHFMEFLGNEPLFQSEDQQDSYLLGEIVDYYYRIQSDANDRIQEVMKAHEGHEYTDDEVAELYRAMIPQVMADFMGNSEKVLFPTYTFSRFRKYAKTRIDELMEHCEQDGLPADMRSEWEQGIYNYLIKDGFFNWSGLVFVGYGTDNLFPAKASIIVSGIFDGNLRFFYKEDDLDRIGFNNEAVISPYAQTDVMLTVMKGIAPAVLEKVSESASLAIDLTREKIAESMKSSGIDEDTIAKVLDIDTGEILDKHKEAIDDFIGKEYVVSLLDTVESFGVEDMANMAESLISITSLQRHFTSAEESVGGPVEVAVITRDRGFVWLKHRDWAASNFR